MTRIEMSLGEVQSLATKAARGAGRPHGTAQDAGYAVRWLCERGEDGAALLLGLLQETDGMPSARLAPGAGQEGPFCPLIAGAYAADLNQTHVAIPVVSADLLRPFLACTAETGAGKALALRAHVDADTLAALEAFAARTYAPATEESRARGAGSGLSDND